MYKFKILTLVLLGFSGAAMAHSGATGIVKERMDSMKSIGTAMKALGGMFAGKLDFNAKTADVSVRIIEQHAVKIPAQFPKGSDHKPTRAMPEVWQNKSEFDQLAVDLAAAAKALGKKVNTASNAGDIKSELIAVGQTCKACHKKFRAPEQ